MIEYCIDLIVISALITVLIAGYKLNKQLKKFYQTYQPVETLNHQLMASLEKTETSVENIKHFSDTTAQSLQEKMTQCTLLKEELSFLISRADHLANQLVDRITVAQPPQHLEKSLPISSTSLKNILRNVR